jgi:hypothetical protein
MSSTKRVSKLFGSKIEAKLVAALGYDTEQNAVQVGTFSTRTNDKCLDILISEWTKRVRTVLALKPSQILDEERQLIPKFVSFDVLTFNEFAEACARGRELIAKYDFTKLNRSLALLELERDIVEANREVELDYYDEVENNAQLEKEYEERRYWSKRYAMQMQAQYADHLDDVHLTNAHERTKEQLSGISDQRAGIKPRIKRAKEYLDYYDDLLEDWNYYVFNKVTKDGEYYNRRLEQLDTLTRRERRLNSREERLANTNTPEVTRGDLLRALEKNLVSPPAKKIISRREPTEVEYDGRLKLLDMKISHVLDDLEIPRLKHHLFRFATLHEEYNFKPDRENYIRYLEIACPDLWRKLCHDFFLSFPALIPARDTWAHTYITGKTGCGKSELLKNLVHHYLYQPQSPSLVVLDPKGDFAEQIATWPELISSDRLIYLNPSLQPGHLPCINPFGLSAANETEVGQVTSAIADVLVEIVNRSGEAKDLTINMRLIFQSCISVLVRLGNKTLLDLLTFLNDDLNTELVAAGCSSPNQIESEFFKRDFNADRFKSTKGALRTKLQTILGSTTLQHLLIGQSTVDLEAAVNSNKVVIFALPKGGAGGNVTDIFGTFVVALLQVIAQRRYSTKEHLRPHTYLFVDECQNYLTPSIETLLSETGRSYRMHLVLAQQFAGQGYRNNPMEQNLKRNISQNTAVKIVGAGGHDQFETMAGMVHSTAQEMATLGTAKGVFVVKSSLPRPIRFIVPPTLIEDRHCVKDEAACEAMHAHQIATYYRAVETSPAPLPSYPDGMTKEEIEAQRTAKIKRPPSAFDTTPRRDRPSRTD